MIYIIVLHNSETRELTEVERLRGSEDQLQQRLVELQSPLCRGERPQVARMTVKSDGAYYNVLMAQCDCKMSHMSVLSKA